MIGTGNSLHYAMHGCGAYKGLRQTNTKEAVEYWYSKGVRIMEIDIAETDDKDYVALAHYLRKRDLERVELFDIPEIKTKDWFTSQKLFSISTSGLTALCLDTIIQLLKEYKNLHVMFDLYGLFSFQQAETFAEVFKEKTSDRGIKDRVLLEAYSKEMVDGIRNVDADINIIYCVRYEKNLLDAECISVDYLKLNNIGYISYPWYITKYHKSEIEQYSSAGVVVYSRTKSNIKNNQLVKAGVTVNIVPVVYDRYLLPIQWLFYHLTYVKRAIVKLYICIFK